MPKPTGPRPKAKITVGSRLVTIGAYGFFSSVRTDFWQIAKDIYDSLKIDAAGKYVSGFTGIVLHINGPWCQDPAHVRYPWPLEGSRFNMKRDNEEYYEAFSTMLEAFEWYGLDVMISFDDQYHNDRWVRLTRAKLHPYSIVNGKGGNNVGVNLAGDKGKFIYDSVELPSGKFDWLSWVIINERTNEFTFKLIGDFGEARGRWFSRCLDIIAARRKASRLLFGPQGNPMGQNSGRPTWRVLIRRANEEQAVVDDATGETSHALSLGDRSEIYAWMHDMMVAKELKPNFKNLFAVVNRDVIGSNIQDVYRHSTVINDDTVTPFGRDFGMGALHEVHVDGAQEIENFIIHSQFRMDRTFPSNDGCPKKSAQAFTMLSRDIWKKKYPFTDLIFEEGGAPGKSNIWPLKPGEKIGFPHDTQRNWNLVFPFHLAMVR